MCFLPRAHLAQLFFLAAISFLEAPSATDQKVISIPYADARPILEAMADALPTALKGLPPDRLAKAWPSWVSKRDAEIRSRLERGDEDSVINFLLFGTSFTHQARLTPKFIQQLGQASQHAPAGSAPDLSAFGKLLDARIQDLLKALVEPGTNERLLFVRHVLRRRGYGLSTAASRTEAAKFLTARLAEMLKEEAGYAQALEAARRMDNPTEELAERSTLFRSRGLSLDTSWRPDFALEESLEALKAQGLLLPKGVRRVAIIGPGLDFTDKQEGYDFYAQQTIQPFALYDTLQRLGLANADDLQITTLDISSRVNDHLMRARMRAQHGIGYVVQLPRDPGTPWKPEAVRYWKRLGDQLGSPVSAAPVPAKLGDLEIRAVRIRPAIVRRVNPVDLDVVLERLEFSNRDQRFDLVIATNILVYYDVLEQNLAMANVETMLRPGGFLLTNNALLELPNSHLRSVGYKTTIYSDAPDDGDHIIWYRNTPN